MSLIAFTKNDIGNAFWKEIGWTKRQDLNYYDFTLNEEISLHLYSKRRSYLWRLLQESDRATGFEAASTAAGIKYQDRTDMALVYSQAPCVAAGTFTTNVVKAAPVKWDRQVIESGVPVQAVIVNSGIANACTGEEGFGYCKETAEAAAEALNIRAEGVTIGSTGVIGMQLPIEKVKAGIRVLAEKKNSSLDNGTDAARAIMTTDTCEKELAVIIKVGEKTVTIGGMAKGSGMIHPNMCTMLAFNHHRCGNRKRYASEGIERGCEGYLQYDLCRRDTSPMTPCFFWPMEWRKRRDPIWHAGV